MMARSNAYTPEAHASIVQALRAGATYRSACQAARLSWTTWKGWKRAVWRGQPVPDPRIADFVSEAEAAHAQATNSLIARVNLAGAKDWRAAMSLIEFRSTAERRRWDLVKARAEARIAQKRLDGSLPAEKHEVSAVAKVVVLPPLEDEHLDADRGVVPEPGPADRVPRDPS